MADKKKREAPVTAWQPGVSPNPNGRPVGSGNKSKSRYRETLSRMKRLEKKSIENIEKAVNGEEVDKQQIDASKFVINTVKDLLKATLAEELALKVDPEDEQPEEEKEEEPVKRFSLHMLPTKTDVEGK